MIVGGNCENIRRSQGVAVFYMNLPGIQKPFCGSENPTNYQFFSLKDLSLVMYEYSNSMVCLVQLF